MQKFKRTLTTGVLGAAIAGTVLTGCSMFQRGDSERTAGRVVDDNRITAQVKSELSREPVYKFNDVDVKTFDGIVQLSGFVNSEDQKQRAESIAQNTSGVSRVVNSITLKPQTPAPTGRPAGTAPNSSISQPAPATAPAQK